MADLKPPGQLALALGTNGIATCECNSINFHGMVKVTENDQILVALKCAVCDNETSVPFDDNKVRKF